MRRRISDRSRCPEDRLGAAHSRNGIARRGGAFRSQAMKGCVMGMTDQVFREQEPVPLEGRLEEIEAVLKYVQDAKPGLDEHEALRRIGLILARAPSRDIYQKPWG